MRMTERKLRRLIRESLLLERKSDIVYRKFVEFVYNEIILKAESVLEVHAAYATKEDWKGKSRGSNKEKRFLTTKSTLMNPKGKENNHWPGLFFTMPDASQSSIYKSLFKKYLEYIKPANDVIFNNDVSNFSYWMSLFSVSIVAYHPGGIKAAGGMDGDGDLSLFYNPLGTFEWPGKNKPIRYTNPPLFTFDSLWKVKYDKATELREAGQPIQKFVTENSEKVRGTLDHELIHFVNGIRSAKGGTRVVGLRSKGGYKQLNPANQEYIDSTEEIQARLLSAQNAFLRAPVIEVKENKRYLTLKGEMFLMLKRGDRQKFILSFINQWYNDYNDEKYNYESHSKRNQKRLMDRAFSFLQEVQKSEEYKKFASNSQYDNLPNLSDYGRSDELVPFDDELVPDDPLVDDEGYELVPFD